MIGPNDSLFNSTVAQLLSGLYLIGARSSAIALDLSWVSDLQQPKYAPGAGLQSACLVRPSLLLSSDPLKEKLFLSGPEPGPQNEYGGTRSMNQTHSMELTHQLSIVSIKDSQSTYRPTTMRINADF